MYQRDESYEYLGKLATSNGGNPKKVDAGTENRSMYTSIAL